MVWTGILIAAGVFVFLILILILFIHLFLNGQKKFNRYSNYVVGVISKMETEISEGKVSLTKERGRNKSVEVRTGFIMERAVPFLEIFGEDPNNIRHLGGEIDYIVFNEDSIVFVEVKTGKARLSKKQNNIKRLIKEGKVEFKLIRMDYE